MLLTSILSPALRNALAPSSKIASALDWKYGHSAAAAVLSVSIRPKGQGLDVAVVRRPGTTKDHGGSTIETIHLESFTQLSELADQQSDVVCGVIVAWPLTSNGRMGGACGSVLRALEKEHANLPSYPICLWDPHHGKAVGGSSSSTCVTSSFASSSSTCDQFGRCAKYGEVEKTGYVEREKHNCWKQEATKTAALDLWRDFCRVHWPQTQTTEELAAAVAVEERKPKLRLRSQSWRSIAGLDKRHSLIIAKA